MILPKSFVVKLENSFQIFGDAFRCAKMGKENLQHIVDTTLKRYSGWREKLLSYISRLILFRASIASIPMYLQSVIKFIVASPSCSSVSLCSACLVALESEQTCLALGGDDDNEG
jgi:hypothetical protein